MQTTTKQVPAGTKVYKTLANACRHQGARPCGIQQVKAGSEFAGFARLPEKIGGAYVSWVM